MAIWVEVGTERPEAIRGTAPRACETPAQRKWRQFVLAVQTHNCCDKHVDPRIREPGFADLLVDRRCFNKHGESLDACKAGYPRPLRDGLCINDETGKYEYRTRRGRLCGDDAPTLARGAFEIVPREYRAWSGSPVAERERPRLRPTATETATPTQVRHVRGRGPADLALRHGVAPGVGREHQRP